MIVDPDHQGKGIGQKLLQWGVDLADREKIVGWLWSRPAAARLYEKNGWIALDSVPIDAPGMTVAPLVSMLRLPRPRESPSG
jgi:GNAT superfamily N-acetyltransferase